MTQAPPPDAPLPFPDSICHRCAAPPRYVRTATSTFIMCPVLPNKYPRQPVQACEAFRARADAVGVERRSDGDGDADSDGEG
jgi:hypothetical protein